MGTGILFMIGGWQTSLGDMFHSSEKLVKALNLEVDLPKLRMYSWFRCVLCDLPAPLRSIEVCEQNTLKTRIYFNI